MCLTKLFQGALHRVPGTTSQMKQELLPWDAMSPSQCLTRGVQVANWFILVANRYLYLLIYCTPMVHSLFSGHSEYWTGVSSMPSHKSPQLPFQSHRTDVLGWPLYRSAVGIGTLSQGPFMFLRNCDLVSHDPITVPLPWGESPPSAVASLLSISIRTGDMNSSTSPGRCSRQHW